jgi:hypothetical protein
MFALIFWATADVVEMAQVARVGNCLVDPVSCRSFR